MNENTYSTYPFANRTATRTYSNTVESVESVEFGTPHIRDNRVMGTNWHSSELMYSFNTI